MMRGFESLKPGITLPKRATQASAGYDFILPETVVIAPSERLVISTYVKAYMGHDEFLSIHIRSSLAVKYHLKLVNQTGIIDSDYYNNPDNEGHIMVALENTGIQPITLEAGSRFVQGIFMKYLTVDEDETKDARVGGLGSTQLK